MSTLEEAVRLAGNWASAHSSYSEFNVGSQKGKRIVQTRSVVPDNLTVQPKSKVTS